MPPVRRLTYTRCPPAYLMISTCDKANRSITATADGKLPQPPAPTGEEGATGTAGKGVGAKNHCCLMLQGLQELRNNDTFCDYSLFADGEVRLRSNTAVAHSSSIRLQALVYDILPSATAIFSYTIRSRKLSANEQFFCWCSNSSKFVTNNYIVAGNQGSQGCNGSMQ